MKLISETVRPSGSCAVLACSPYYKYYGGYDFVDQLKARGSF